MCKWIERTYCCGHEILIAHEWCSEYKETFLRCEPQVTNYQYMWPEKCPRCRPKLLPDWLARTPYGLRFRTQDELRAMGIAP